MSDKVLIIDDDIDTLRLVGLMLQHQGYQILAASSGEQGLAKADQEHPAAILLDVMMPEMDGYEVVRRLKNNPRTRDTPILMFTAKTQLEDKVAGFEAGADDYLTKPTNPAELQSHLRLLLERARERTAKPVAPAIETHRAHAIAVLAARGGLGVSTIAANLAAALHLRSQAEVILAELTPGRGALGMELGAPNQRALSTLLTTEPELITPERVNAALVHHGSGVELLLASENPREVALSAMSEQLEAVFNALRALASFIVIDLGSALPAWSGRILLACQDRIVVTEAVLNTVAHTRILLDEMAALGIAPAAITVVLNNRVRFDAPLPWAEAQQGLGHPITATLSPAPELMAAAARRHLPGVLAMPENVTSQQVLGLADKILGRSQKAA
jgi:CheY-like chemotaxis protein